MRWQTPNNENLIDGTLNAIEVPECDGAKRLYDLWLSHKPKTDLPFRSDFTIELLKDAGLLGVFFVIEPLDGGKDWQYRLMGSDITLLFNATQSNVPFTQIYQPEVAKNCIALSNQVARSKEPLFLKSTSNSSLVTGEFETMSLPVWNDDRSLVWLVGATFFEAN
ncbi:PAS domain-containing protein [Rhodovibrionaceae bacterium A322]